MLELRFSPLAGRVCAACDSSSGEILQRLRARYASSTSLSPNSFEVDIDDFLLNLHELVLWPVDDLDVRWQHELLRLVESNAADAALMQAQLANPVECWPVGDSSSELTGWTADLTEFQCRDLKKLRGLAHGANFSVPGAGKTRVALAVFHETRNAMQVKQMLVVCPKSAFESWQYEAQHCFAAPQTRIAIMSGAVPPFADIVLVNYERLPDAHSILAQWLRAQPTMLVLDEAHRMKLGAAGAWGRSCLALGPWAVRRLILTGTPAPNSSKDLENLFSFVWPGQGRATIAAAIDGGDLRAASARLKPLFTRTTKRELNLPPVDLVVRRVDLPSLHREIYRALLGEFSNVRHQGDPQMEALGRIVLYLLMAATTPALLATGGSKYEPLPYRVPPLQPPPGSSLGELMRDLPHYELSPKYKEVLAIVAENAARGRKTLVWSTFVRSLRSLEVLLAKFKPALIHGGTEDRQGELTRFRNAPDCFVLLSNPATLGEGVSLHHVCHDAVYVDRDFAAGRFLQSLDRIHRLGLPSDVETRITVLVANETIDELVEQRLSSKLRFMGGVLDDPAVLELEDLDEEPSVAAGMNEADLKALMGYIQNVSF